MAGSHTVTWASGRPSNVWVGINDLCTGPDTCEVELSAFEVPLLDPPPAVNDGVGSLFSATKASLVNGQWTMTVSTGGVYCGAGDIEQATVHYSWDEATLNGTATSDGPICDSARSDTFTLS